MKIHTKKLNAYGIIDVLIILFMLLFMATIILPFIHIIAVSFSGNYPVMAGLVSFWPKEFTLETYRHVLNDGSFFVAYGNTIFYTVVGTTMSLTVTAMAAYALSSKKLVGHKLISLMITFTMFFSGGLIPEYLAVSNYGLINSRWAMIIPVLINTWNLIVMRSFFAAYPSEIIESGMIDGLQEAGVFFRLVLPTSKAALATIGLYYAVSYWNSYMPSRLYLRDDALRPVQHLLQLMIDSTKDAQFQPEGRVVGAAMRYGAILVTVLPIMCVYPWLQKFFVKGVMVGSIKG